MSYKRASKQSSGVKKVKLSTEDSPQYLPYTQQYPFDRQQKISIRNHILGKQQEKNGQLVVYRRNHGKNPVDPIHKIKESVFDLESHPMARLVLAIVHEERKERNKMNWIVLMVNDLEPLRKPSHWTKLHGVYFKFKLDTQTLLARVVRVGDIETLISAFESFVSVHSALIKKYVLMDECFAMTSKPITILKSMESEFVIDKISCFESQKWEEVAESRQKQFAVNERNEKEQEKETTDKSKQVNRQPRKSLFYEKLNKSPEDMLDTIENNERDYLFIKETCSSIVKTLDPNDIKKTLLENMCKLLEINYQNTKMLTKILKKDQLVQMTVPENDETMIKGDNILIEGILQLPVKNYHAAIAQRDPSKIVSHLVRKCFPQELYNCYLISKDKDKQLNYALGDPNFEEKERIEDGEKKIMALIVHAFRQVNKKSFTFREQQDGRREISQALSDLRRYLKSLQADCHDKRKQTKESDLLVLSEDEQSSNDGKRIDKIIGYADNDDDYDSVANSETSDENEQIKSRKRKLVIGVESNENDTDSDNDVVSLTDSKQPDIDGDNDGDSDGDSDDFDGERVVLDENDIFSLNYNSPKFISDCSDKTTASNLDTSSQEF